jgi:subtilisin family serine protease
MNTRLLNLFNGTQLRKAAVFSMAAIIGLSSTISMSAQGAPGQGQQTTARPQQLTPLQKQQLALRKQQFAGRPQQLTTAQQQQLLAARQQQLGARRLAAKPAKVKRHDCPDLSRDDLVLVMPKSGADKDEMNKSLEDVHGTVIGTIGKGDLKVLVVKAEKGKAQEMEKKLSKDTKSFRAVNVNRRVRADYVPTDPTVSVSWHLPTMNCYNAWDLVKKAPSNFGYYNAIAVMDSGCSWQGDTGIHNWGADVTGVHRDIAEKLEDEMDGFLGTGLFGNDVEDLDNEIEHWGNYAHTLSMGVQDNHGHGTWVAACAAGDENGKNSVGVAPGTAIYPIKIADGPAGAKIYTDDISLISGMVCALESRVRIVNISYSGMNDVDSHEVLHELFKHFYYKKNGIIFVSAGNDGNNLPYADLPYINCVSALKQVTAADIKKGAAPLQLVTWADTGMGWASNTGRCVDFGAPGIDIQVTGPTGSADTVGGTSFSSPIVAGVAALILKVNPKLSNSQVQNILINSCGKNGQGRNTSYGFGMPDAEQAVKLALRG